MLIGFGIITAISLLAMYVMDARETRRRRMMDSVRTGIDPQFARISEAEWCELTLSTERARW